MTQEVQPLTWSKRTNLEEHQQFFSKINEIIDNLAPTVDEAEQAIAQATQAITNANAAIATANAASAAADAAAQQAQTAAATVAGYDTRLTAAEGGVSTNAANITALQGRMGTAEGNITSLGTRMSTAETKNNQQDTAIAALQTADANNVKITGEHAIGNYAVTLSDNQPIYGIKTFLGELIRQGSNSPAIYIDNLSVDRTERPESTQQCWLQCRDRNFEIFGMLQFVMLENGYRVCQVTMFDKEGGQHIKNILTIDEDGNVIA